MKRAIYTPLAESDLREIWRYSAQHWSEGQADKYIRAIHSICDDVARGRRRGRDASDLKPGYFKILSGSHIIFFRRLESGETEVVRVLHQAMDAPTHLES